MIWRAWCWLLNICPWCEQTYMYGTRHWPNAKCPSLNATDGTL